MYSGFLVSDCSGNFFGTHQKLNKAAFKYLAQLVKEKHCDDDYFFPPLDLILHFEGYNGPDGLKLKSPGYNEPYHFYNPYQPQTTNLLHHLERHYHQLKKALLDEDLEKSAFEAAWLAHAIVDGLTPAHHYPYEESLSNLRGQANGNQNKVLSKLFIKRQRHLNQPIESLGKVIQKNWNLLGSKGLMSTHAFFELGAAILIKSLGLKKAQPSLEEIKNYQQLGLIETFKDYSRQIADQDMYHHFYLWGWTSKLAWQINNCLVPLIVKLIILAWYDVLTVTIKSPQNAPNYHRFTQESTL